MQASQTIAGRFQVERLAGSGGMGAVYRALDKLTGQPVAIKVMHGPANRETERFVREGAVLATLQHQGIVRYIAHGFTDEQEAYLAMEWLDGEDLADRLAREPLSPRESVTLVRTVAEALGVAHARSVIHRDIKPSNIFLVDKDVSRAKVLDFGIARRGGQSLNMTRTGVMLGTPGYMAPEQARADRALDGRADVFALGCVLYECVIGRPPFIAENLVGLLAKILLEDAPRMRDVRPDLPPALDVLVARMLSKSPETRPADGREVAEALMGIDGISDERPVGRPTPPQALTRGEQRSYSVVLIRGVSTPKPDESFVSRDLPTRVVLGATVVATPQQPDAIDPYTQIRNAAFSWGGRAEALADGSIVVTIATRDHAADQAVRAARCAIAMQTLVPHAIVAVATGRGEMAARLPVGEVIDQAARLLRDTPLDASAQPGTPPPIRINEVTAGLLDGRFEVQRDSQMLVLRAERSEPDAARTLLGKPTSCVGRDRELANLDATFTECVDESLARVVVMTSPPGVGKSRVRHEFTRRLATRPEPPTVLLARGDPMRAAAPFGILAQLLRGAFDVRENEAIDARRAKLKTGIEALLRGADARRVIDFLGEMIGVPSADLTPPLKAARQDAGAMHDQMLRAWLEYATAATQAGPIALLIEDLQWGDRTSCTFIDAALRDLSQAPLLVAAFARPEIDDVFPKLWSERGVATIRLPDLPKKASERLARQVLGPSVPQETIDKIVSQSAGNAYFLEELIRSVAEGRGDSLPGTVLAMAEARLEALNPDERRLLRAASVFGQVFWEGGVRALLGQNAKTTHVADWLQSLVQRELVTKRAEGKFEGESDYAFRQGLMREVAYSMLTPADRSLGHKLAGTWLEKMGETEAATLAEHFERGNEKARAVEWYRKAAQQALEGNDLPSVLARVDRGIACGAEGETLGSLYTLRTEALMWSGAFAESQQRALEAIELLPRGGEMWFKAVGLGMWLSRNINDRASIARLADVLMSQGRSPDAGGAPAMPWALALWSLILLRRYDLAAQITTWIEDLQKTTPADDTRTLAWIHFGLHFGRLHLGDPEPVWRDAQLSVRYFFEFGDRLNGGAALSCSARAALNIGYIEDAEEAVRRAIELNEQLNLVVLAAASKRFLAYVLLRKGDVDQALALVEEAIEVLATERSDALVGLWRTDAAIHASLCGFHDRAEQLVVPSLEALRSAPPTRALALMALARAHVHKDRAPEALVLMREADALIEQVGGRIGDHDLFVRLVRAETLHANKLSDEAWTTIDDACARVMTVAERIRDEKMRQSFVERVPENLQILALAERIAASR